jgi:methylmalonyl-CoA mutase
MDPLGVLSHEGKLPQSMKAAYHEMEALTRWAASHAPELQTICVHSRAYHEAGANAVQELACSLATGVEYLKAMNERGLEVNLVAPRLRFAITVGERFFLEIAKLRALRMLWSRAVSEIGGNEEAQRLSLHVRTSLWDKTASDPYNNLLRATVEAFSGVLAGCDSLQVGAFDEVVRPPDDFSRRVARNIQLVLQKECNLESVIDPAGGSWYVECLTSELANKAWSLFQEIWQAGGMEAALRAGFPQKQIGGTAAEKIKAVNLRRDAIVGVNQYANPSEKPLEAPVIDASSFHKRRVQQITSHRTSMEEDRNELVLERLAQVVEAKGTELFPACVQAVTAGATLGEITRAIRINDSPSAPITPVCITRAAQQVEALRNGRVTEPTKVFLCNMGSLKEHKARADFARGFFAVGGSEATSPPGSKTPEDAAEAFAKSGSRVAVICSTDENYPTLVPPLVKALRAKRSDAIIVLAGYPQDQVEAHKAAGVDEFIHIRADAVQLLSKINGLVGVQK